MNFEDLQYDGMDYKALNRSFLIIFPTVREKFMFFLMKCSASLNGRKPSTLSF